MTHEDSSQPRAPTGGRGKTLHIKHRGDATQQDGCFSQRNEITERRKSAQQAIVTDHRYFNTLSIGQSHDDRDDAAVWHVDPFERLAGQSQHIGLPQFNGPKVRTNKFKIVCG